MAIVTVEIVRRSMTFDQKQELIGRMIDALAAVQGDAIRRLAIVKISELDDGNCSMGGVPLNIGTLRTATDFRFPLIPQKEPIP